MQREESVTAECKIHTRQKWTVMQKLGTGNKNLRRHNSRLNTTAVSARWMTGCSYGLLTGRLTSEGLRRRLPAALCSLFVETGSKQKQLHRCKNKPTSTNSCAQGVCSGGFVLW